jgi:hypothetical protein
LSSTTRIRSWPPGTACVWMVSNLCLCCLLGSRQVQTDRGLRAGRTFYSYMPIALADEAIDHAEAEAGKQAHDCDSNGRARRPGHAQDKYSLELPTGIAFFDFKRYEDWAVVSSARTDEALKVIVANPTMIEAYKAGVQTTASLYRMAPAREALVEAEEEHEGPYFKAPSSWMCHTSSRRPSSSKRTARIFRKAADGDTRCSTTKLHPTSFSAVFPIRAGAGALLHTCLPPRSRLARIQAGAVTAPAASTLRTIFSFGQILVRARFLSMFTQQESVPRTAGSGPARVRCRNLFLSTNGGCRRTVVSYWNWRDSFRSRGRGHGLAGSVRQHDGTAMIMTHDVERVLAGIDCRSRRSLR